MELGGNGGFQGYQKLQRTSSEVRMGQAPSPQTNHHNTPEDTECTVREQDRFMPIANVIRIMRKILPPHAKISDDAKETIQECVSEYISFITSEANDRCQREQRKTITAEDVLWAMSKLGFDDYIEPLTLFLHRYREYDGGERGSLRGEPMVKRAADHASFGFPGFPTAGFHVAHHHGFFGAPMMNGFLKDPSNVGPSQPATMPLACVEPFTQCKEQV
ncbi:nuclear transcription factor Y subunit B-6-like [Primulina eburnea]|uniref:nuclear transcription factor Y subunit B-6-like n=1 Tax=Primulina eburnea TaxID=1245227 RepID=UPI003C6C77F1